MLIAVQFCCPVTGEKVQEPVPEETFEHRHDTYVAIDCTACGSVHLVNPPTGKTLDEGDGLESP